MESLPFYPDTEKDPIREILLTPSLKFSEKNKGRYWWKKIPKLDSKVL